MTNEVWDKDDDGGVYSGEPKAATVGGHTSAVERFTDSGFHTVPWTVEMALSAAGVRRGSGASYEERFGALRKAKASGKLPDEAVEAAKRAYPAL